MQLVIDANIVIAALIAGKGKTAELIFSEEVELLAPDFLIEELEKHSEEIRWKSKLSAEDFGTLLALTQKRVTFTPLYEFEDMLEKSRSVCPDNDDVLYFALALKQECAVWSNEKKLKKQSEVKVFSTHELAQKFSKRKPA